MGHLDRDIKHSLKHLDIEAKAGRKYAERIYETYAFFEGFKDKVKNRDDAAKKMLLAITRFLEYAESSIKADRLGDTVGYVVGAFEFGILSFKYENEDLDRFEAEKRDLLELAKQLGQDLFYYDKKRQLNQKISEVLDRRRRKYNHRGWTKKQKVLISDYIRKFE